MLAKSRANTIHANATTQHYTDFTSNSTTPIPIPVLSSTPADTMISMVVEGVRMSDKRVVNLQMVVHVMVVYRYISICRCSIVRTRPKVSINKKKVQRNGELGRQKAWNGYRTE
jgi:hypothetical protein